jgi:hypothetical protein
MPEQILEVGDAVTPSGEGYTKHWNQEWEGVITRVFEDGMVRVQWPGVEDDMEPQLVKPTGERGRQPPRGYTVYYME